MRRSSYCRGRGPWPPSLHRPRRCRIAPTPSSSRSRPRRRGRVLDSVVERTPSGVIRTHTRGGDRGLHRRRRHDPHGSRARRPAARRHRRVDPRRAAVRAGDDVVLCLARTAGGYRTVSMGFSAFRVGAAVSGDRPLARFGGAAVVGGRGMAGVEASRGLEEFRRAAGAITGVSARGVLTEAQATAAVAAVASDRVGEPFTLLGDGVRWQQADGGLAIAWVLGNTLSPSPIEDADTDDQRAASLRGPIRRQRPSCWHSAGRGRCRSSRHYRVRIRIAAPAIWASA